MLCRLTLIYLVLLAQNSGPRLQMSRHSMQFSVTPTQTSEEPQFILQLTMVVPLIHNRITQVDLLVMSFARSLQVLLSLADYLAEIFMVLKSTARLATIFQTRMWMEWSSDWLQRKFS